MDELYEYCYTEGMDMFDCDCTYCPYKRECFGLGGSKWDTDDVVTLDIMRWE